MRSLRLFLVPLVTAILCGPFGGVAFGDVSPPTIGPVQLTDMMPTSVTFNLRVTRNGAPVGVSLEYGPDTNYGTLVGTGDLPDATEGEFAVAIGIGSLTAGTRYHYRVLADNSAGQVMTEDRIFTAGDNPPHASGDHFIRRDGIGPFELPVLSNDFDQEQSSLQIIGATQGAHGAVTVRNDGAFITYQLLENGFVGDDTFTYTITDRSGATDTAPVIIHLGRLPVVTEALFVTGDEVPGAGQPDSGVPAGARFLSFGFPSINDGGQVAFSAQIVSSAGGASVIIGPDIHGNAGVLVATGDPAPGEEGTPLGPRFATFLHPLLNDAGDVAFLGVLAGARVNSGNDFGIWVMENGQLRLVAREGDRARGIPGSATFKSFRSVALADRNVNSDGDLSMSATVAFVAQLLRGRGGVTETNDLGLWRHKRRGPTQPALELLLREGTLFDARPDDNIPGRSVFSFTALEPQRGAAGHGFGLAIPRAVPPSEDLLARIKFADGEEAIVEFQSGSFAPIFQVAETDDPFGHVPFGSFDIPTQSADGQNAFVAKLDVGEGEGVGGGDYNAVFVANDLDTPNVFGVAQEGGPVPSVEGAQFADFHQVVNNGRGFYAFGATIAGTGINASNDTGIWFNAFPEPVALAREGGDAPGADGAKFTTFLSLAMRADGGAIFSATAGEPRSIVRPKGVWFTDDDFALRLAIKEGDRIDGGVRGRLGWIRSLSILEHVIGSPAQTRSFNNRGDLIYRASFKGGGQAIVKSTVPGARD